MEGKSFPNKISTISYSTLLTMANVTHKIPVNGLGRKSNCVIGRSIMHLVLFTETMLCSVEF